LDYLKASDLHTSMLLNIHPSC